MTHTVLTDRLQILSREHRQLIESSFISEAAELFGSGEGLSADQIFVLENGLALYLLFLLTKEELIAFIRRECDVDTSTATRIVYAFTATLPPQFLEQHPKLCAALNQPDPNVADTVLAVPIPPATVPPPSSTPQTPASIQLESDIAEAEAALRALEPVRTMAHDMDTIRRAEHPTTTAIPTPPSAAQAISVKPENSPLQHAARWDSER